MASFKPTTQQKDIDMLERFVLTWHKTKRLGFRSNMTDLCRIAKYFEIWPPIHLVEKPS